MRFLDLVLKASSYRKTRKLFRDPKAFVRDAIVNRSGSQRIDRPSNPRAGRRVLTVCHDDSTLFATQNFVALMSRDPSITCFNVLLTTKRNGDFVERCAENPFFDAVHTARIWRREYLTNFDAVFFAKVPPGLLGHCTARNLLEWQGRPVLICGFPGVELTPEKGLRNRLVADVVLFNTQSDRRAFEYLYDDAARTKKLLVGNPSIVARWLEAKESRAKGEDTKSLVFFTQNITPVRLSGRQMVLRDLMADPKANPLVLKVRQRRGENQGHVHRELFAYESLLQQAELSEQVETTDGSMSEVLAAYQRFISCSSTAVFEAAAMGKDVGFISAFDQWEVDWAHVASLGYSTRYGMDVDIRKDFSVEPPPDLFFEDFALNDDNPLLEPRTLLEPRPLPFERATQRLESARALPVSREQTAKAYVAVGNPQMALFQRLRSIPERPHRSPGRDRLDDCLSAIPDAERLCETYVRPLENSARYSPITNPWVRRLYHSDQRLLKASRRWLGLE